MTERPSGSGEPAGGLAAFSIPTGSVEPTLEPGDGVLVREVVYGPDRGDVIVFSYPKGRPGPDRAFAIVWPSSRVGWIH